jgi:hypothetical protein
MVFSSSLQTVQHIILVLDICTWMFWRSFGAEDTITNSIILISSMVLHALFSTSSYPTQMRRTLHLCLPFHILYYIHHFIFHYRKRFEDFIESKNDDMHWVAVQKLSGLRFMALDPTARLKCTKGAIRSGIRVVIECRVVVGVTSQDDLMIKGKVVKWILYLSL